MRPILEEIKIGSRWGFLRSVYAGIASMTSGHINLYEVLDINYETNSLRIVSDTYMRGFPLQYSKYGISYSLPEFRIDFFKNPEPHPLHPVINRLYRVLSQLEIQANGSLLPIILESKL